jgi:hypothetical protein
MEVNIQLQALAALRQRKERRCPFAPKSIEISRLLLAYIINCLLLGSIVLYGEPG